MLPVFYPVSPQICQPIYQNIFILEGVDLKNNHIMIIGQFLKITQEVITTKCIFKAEYIEYPIGASNDSVGFCAGKSGTIELKEIRSIRPYN